MAPRAHALKPVELPELDWKQADELRTFIQLRLIRNGAERFTALQWATNIVAQFPMRPARG